MGRGPAQLPGRLFLPGRGPAQPWAYRVRKIRARKIRSYSGRRPPLIAVNGNRSFR